MMTRHCTRRHIPRPPYPSCPKRPSIRNNSIHYLRSILLPWLLLSILPLKPSPHSWIGRLLTPYRHYSPKSLRSPPPKHSSPTGIRSYRNLSSPQHYRRGAKTSNPIPHPNNPSRFLLYIPTSNRVLWSPLHNRRWCLRLNLLRRHRLPRPSRHHRIDLLSRMSATTNPIPLHLRTPLWLRSSRLILTLCRCCLIILIHLNLLMRLIIFLV